MKEGVITQTIPGGFSIIACSFLTTALEHMIPWLFVSFIVVICDLFFGLRKAIALREDIRFSSAVRRTMGKMVTYFAFVCMVVMINIASGLDLHIDVYACLLVCFIEFCSIISNILKPKGICFSMLGLFGILFGKALKIDKTEINEVIHADHEFEHQNINHQKK